MQKPMKSKRIATLSMLAAVCLMCLGECGCNYIMVFGYLLGGPPSVEPLFDKETKKSMTDKDIRVCVICFAENKIKYNFESIDYELAHYVAMQLHSHKIEVVNPDQVKAWLEENKDWDKPEELGAYFKVNYVVYIDLNQFSLYEDGSAELYRGKAESIVSVWEIDEDGHGEKIFSKEKLSKYPLHVPVSAAEKSYQTFKGEYLTHLSEAIGRLFYEYYVADDFATGGG